MMSIMFIYLLTCLLNSVSQDIFVKGIEGKRGRNIRAKKMEVPNKMNRAKLITIDSLRRGTVNEKSYSVITSKSTGIFFFSNVFFL